METLIDLAVILVLVVSVFLLVFGLFFTPWQVLLLFLVIGLVTIWWLSKQNPLEGFSLKATNPEMPDANTATTNQTPPAPKEEPLSYRGATYQPGAIAASEQPTNQIQVSGKYRGSVWRKEPRTSAINQAQKSEITGKYRGCTWKSTSSEN